MREIDHMLYNQINKSVELMELMNSKEIYHKIFLLIRKMYIDDV